MTERLWKINIAPYDQVIALTQHSINNAISNLYTRLETGEVDGASMPEPAEEYADEKNFVTDVVFGPPTVMIAPKFDNVKEVKLALHLKSGKAQMSTFIPANNKIGRKANTQIWAVDIDDWVITIPVDVGFTEVNPKTARGKAVVERSAAKGNPNHSIYELLMDLSTMKSGDITWTIGHWTDDDWLVNKDKSKVRPKGWELEKARDFNDFDTDFQTALELNIKKLVPRLAEANMTSLGFAVMAEDASQRATFDVNNARYMTYPWVNPETGVQAPASLDGDGRLNYLLYLETVKDHKPPDETKKSAILDTTMGNWTDGRMPGTDAPSKFGRFVLSCDNFMESFLLPKFGPVNRIMSMNITNVTAWCEKPWFRYKWAISSTYVLNNGLRPGDTSQDSTTFKLTKTPLTVDGSWQQDAKDFLSPLTSDPGPGSNVWTYQDVEWGSTAKHAYKEDSTGKVWSDGDTITFARLYTVAGHNTIVYEGRTWSKLEHKLDPGWLMSYRSGGMVCKSAWTITLTMSEVLDGGMQFVINYSRPTLEFHTWGEGEDSAVYTKEEEALSSMYATAGSNFDYFINSVSNSLKGAERFTLLASGVYYFKNPIMDSHGSLVCELEYDGNPKLGGTINDDGEARVSLAQGTWTDVPPARVINAEGEIKKRDGDKEKTKDGDEEKK